MTSFPHTDVALREELNNMQNELATLVLEATKLKMKRNDGSYIQSVTAWRTSCLLEVM